VRAPNAEPRATAVTVPLEVVTVVTVPLEGATVVTALREGATVVTALREGATAVTVLREGGTRAVVTVLLAVAMRAALLLAVVRLRAATVASRCASINAIRAVPNGVTQLRAAPSAKRRAAIVRLPTNCSSPARSPETRPRARACSIARPRRSQLRLVLRSSNNPNRRS
jgi:hypothetical protein